MQKSSFMTLISKSSDYRLERFERLEKIDRIVSFTGYFIELSGFTGFYFTGFRH